MSDDEIACAGARIFELFAACAADPDDVEAGRAADEALRRLDRLLAPGPAKPPAGPAKPPAGTA